MKESEIQDHERNLIIMKGCCPVCRYGKIRLHNLSPIKNSSGMIINPFIMICDTCKLVWRSHKLNQSKAGRVRRTSARKPKPKVEKLSLPSL